MRSRLSLVVQRLKKEKISFEAELKNFLPKTMSALIKNFDQALIEEIEKRGVVS